MNPLLRPILPLLFAVLLPVFVPSAAAAERAVIVVGNSKAKELQVVTTAAGEAVEQGSWTVVAHKLPPERVASVFECIAKADAQCIGKLLDDVGADRLIALKLADETYKKKPVRVVHGSVLRRGGDVLSSGQRYCDECRDDLLADHVRSLVTDLVKGARRKANPSTLVVRSDPAGASVAIDGRVLGPAEEDLSIDPGVHTLEVTLKGYREHTEEITVDDGQRLEIDVALVPLDGSKRVDSGAREGGDQRTGTLRALAPWLVVAGGVGLAVGGAVMIKMDEDEVEGGTVVPSYRDSATRGAVLATAGGVAIVSGALWWWWSRKESAVTPTVTVRDGGAHVGIAGRF